MSQFEEAKLQWQAKQRESAASTLGSVLASGRSVSSLSRVAAQLETHVDRAIAERHAGADVLRRGGRQLPQVACCKGCSACCHTMRVLASGLEVVRLVSYLRSTLGVEEIEALVLKLRAYDRVVTIRLDGTPAPQRIACVFLEHDACSVYAARPIACRAFHSLDLSKCLARFEDPSRGDVPQILDVFDAVAPVVAGIEQGLGRFGLRGSPLLLWKAVLIALEDSSACERYLAGEDVFASATSAAIERAAKAGGLTPR